MPPNKVSAPAPPSKVSLPRIPYKVLATLLPLIRSLPSPPKAFSITVLEAMVRLRSSIVLTHPAPKLRTRLLVTALAFRVSVPLTSLNVLRADWSAVASENSLV